MSFLAFIWIILLRIFLTCFKYMIEACNFAGSAFYIKYWYRQTKDHANYSSRQLLTRNINNSRQNTEINMVLLRVSVKTYSMKRLGISNIAQLAYAQVIVCLKIPVYSKHRCKQMLLGWHSGIVWGLQIKLTQNNPPTHTHTNWNYSWRM